MFTVLPRLSAQQISNHLHPHRHRHHHLAQLPFVAMDDANFRRPLKVVETTAQKYQRLRCVVRSRTWIHRATPWWMAVGTM